MLMCAGWLSCSFEHWHFIVVSVSVLLQSFINGPPISPDTPHKLLSLRAELAMTPLSSSAVGMRVLLVLA